MSLISGPGRGGSSSEALPGELTLVIDKHVQYIQSLDNVRAHSHFATFPRSSTDSDKMNWNIG